MPQSPSTRAAKENPFAIGSTYNRSRNRKSVQPLRSEAVLLPEDSESFDHFAENIAEIDQAIPLNHTTEPEHENYLCSTQPFTTPKSNYLKDHVGERKLPSQPRQVSNTEAVFDYPPQNPISNPLSFEDNVAFSNSFPDVYDESKSRKIISQSSKLEEAAVITHRLAVHDDEFPEFKYQQRAAHQSRKDFACPENPTNDVNGTGRMPVLFRSFDVLCHNTTYPTPCNVLVLGYSDGVDVFQISRAKSKIIGSIRELRGKVRSAKIVPWASHRIRTCIGRPLLSIVRDAPCDTESTNKDLYGAKHSTLWQTFVEIYSLKTSERISVLYTSEPVAVSTDNLNTPGTTEPSFRLDVCGAFLTVASAASGEIWIFSTLDNQYQNVSQEFRCIGKIWTSIHLAISESISNQTTHEDRANQQDNFPIQRRTPLYALTHRWLAFMPPSIPAIPSVRGTAHCLRNDSSVPGLQSLTSPAPFLVDCSLEQPEDENIVRRVARGVAQEVLKNARWASIYGTQTWNKYWSQEARFEVYNTTGSRVTDVSVRPSSDFSPHTDGSIHPAISHSGRPGRISVIDLQSLLSADGSFMAEAPKPLATFPILHGCSYLSFSPDGLNLLTVNYKGDEHNIWDLMGLRTAEYTTSSHGKASQTDTSSSQLPASILKIAKHARYTDSNVVDVVWSVPRGRRMALLTRKGTVHLFKADDNTDKPVSGSRRLSLPNPSKAKEHCAFRDEISTPTIPPNGFWNTAVQTSILLANRARSLSSGSNSVVTISPQSRSALTVKGGKAIAAGLNKSYGAASDSINLIRHLSDNKLHLDINSDQIGVGHIMLLSGQDEGFIATTSERSIRFHAIQSIAVKHERRLSFSKNFRIEQTLQTRRNLVRQPKKKHNIDTNVQQRHQYLDHVVRQVDSADEETDYLHSLPLAELDVGAPNRALLVNSDHQIYSIKEATSGRDSFPNPQHLDKENPWAFGTLSMLQIVQIKMSTSESSGNWPVTIEDESSNSKSVEVQSKGKASAMTLDLRTETLFEEDCEILGDEIVHGK